MRDEDLFAPNVDGAAWPARIQRLRLAERSDDEESGRGIHDAAVVRRISADSDRGYGRLAGLARCPQTEVRDDVCQVRVAAGLNEQDGALGGGRKRRREQVVVAYPTVCASCLAAVASGQSCLEERSAQHLGDGLRLGDSTASRSGNQPPPRPEERERAELVDRAA